MPVRTRLQRRVAAANASMKLPAELWFRIVGFATDLDSPSRPDFADHLLPPYSKNSLRAKLDISAVSRNFRRISVPLLYESIVIESREALRALEYTLVRCPAAKGSASCVRMLRIALKTYHRTDIRNGKCKLLSRIVGNTTNLKVFHMAPLPDDNTLDREVELFVPRIPSSVESISWHIGCSSEKSKAELCRAISSCSRSLRSLSIDRSSYISPIVDSELLECRSLTHFGIDAYAEKDPDFRHLLQHSAITHVVVRFLLMKNRPHPVSFPHITSISATFVCEIKTANLNLVFPSLETLSFATIASGTWLESAHHRSLRAIIFDNRQTLHFSRDSNTYWSILQDHLPYISTERFPGLRSVALKFRTDVFSGGFWYKYKSSVEELSAHLRDAGILVEVS